MRLVLVGPPGSGKGTQAKWLAQREGLATIGTGDLLRAAIRDGTEVGRSLAPLLNAGRYAPDRVVNGLIESLLTRPDRPTDFVMDGYPRTVAQAVWFEGRFGPLGLGVELVVNFVTPDDEVVRRIGGRRVCSNPACGVPYNVVLKPPRAADVCDVCGSPLARRADDAPATVRERLAVFHATTDPLIAHYREAGVLKDVSALDPPDMIYETVLRLVRP